jgi:hypothetical protein
MCFAPQSVQARLVHAFQPTSKTHTQTSDDLKYFGASHNFSDHSSLGTFIWFADQRSLVPNLKAAWAWYRPFELVDTAQQSKRGLGSDPCCGSTAASDFVL